MELFHLLICERTMEQRIRPPVSWLCLLLLLVFFITPPTVSQYNRPYCTHFQSPMYLTTEGSRPKQFGIPIHGNKYLSNQVCEWSIDTESETDIVRIQVDFSNLEGKDIYGDCNNDYVDLFDLRDGYPHFIDRFCGSDKGLVYDSEGPRMIVKFYSNGNFEFGGFRASYQAVAAGSSDDGDVSQSVAVAVPVSLVVLTVIIVIAICVMCRYRRAKQAAAQMGASNRATTSEQWRTPAAPSSTAEAPDHFPFVTDHYPNQEGGRIYGRNTRLQVALPPYRGQADPQPARGDTPPPAYDSLDHISPTMDHLDGAVTPPPYEMVVKETSEAQPSYL